MINVNSLSPVGLMMRQDEVQSVVHDLRNPMTVIKGNLKLLLSGAMGSMTDEQLTLIQRSVDPLEDLILLTDNLLQSASLEQKDLTISREEVDLDKLLSETIEIYSAAFLQRGMQLVRYGNSFGTKLNLDLLWVKRVLNNLVWNAFKFTGDHGRVIIRAKKSADGLDLCVEDNGRGIPAHKIGSLFQKFIQASPAQDREIGTGLGLWICKRVLELHGGTVQVQSDEGKGSRFTLHFPADCII